jgi:hypothetical protein
MTAPPNGFVIERPFFCKTIEKDDRTICPGWIYSLKPAFHQVAIPCVEKEIAGN